MKKLLIIVIVIGVVLYVVLNCGGVPIQIKDYSSTITGVKGNVIELASGLHVKLIGVQSNRTDVEMFIKNGYINKQVTLIPDSKGDQEIESIDETVGAYVIVTQTGQCLNHLVVSEYPDSYRQIELTDSGGWVPPIPVPEIKHDLALYMKQRTFLIQVQTEEGTSVGTGFFINDKGLAITNWHVLPTGSEDYATAFLYQENPDDNKIYTNKKRRIRNILWSEDTDGMDISIFSVELEPSDQISYFNLAKKSAAQGEDCATYGNPLGTFTASYSGNGTVSAYRDDERPKRNVKLMQYTIATNPGNSGGPVCDKYGQIIAVHELGMKEAQGMNFGIDIMQIRQILNQQGFKYGGK